MVQAALAEIGIKVKILVLPWSQLLRNETMQQCNLYLIASTGGHAEGKRYLDNWFHSHSIGANNFMGFRNAEFDRLIDEADVTANPERRRQLYLKACEIIVEEAPWLFLFHPVYYMVRQPRVKGLRSNAGGSVRLRSVWLDSESSH